LAKIYAELSLRIFYCAFVFIYFRRCAAITGLMINEQIRDKEIRLIDSDGAQLGIVALRDAQKLAEDKKLDLVKISPSAKPPVCKIMDYSKYKFDQAKKEKEVRKRQKTFEVKELRLSPNIDTHDIDVKIRKALEFLAHGDKVKITIRFRGRELGHTEFAYGILHEFADKVSAVGVVEKPPKMEAKTMAMFLTPKL
jgi:translation initiation factor IF-3